MKASSDMCVQEPLFVSPARTLVATSLTDGEQLVPHAIGQAKTSHARFTPSASTSVQAREASVEQLTLDRGVRSRLLHLARQIQAQGVSCDSVTEHGYAPDVVRAQLRSSVREASSRLLKGIEGRGKGKLELISPSA